MLVSILPNPLLLYNDLAHHSSKVEVSHILQRLEEHNHQGNVVDLLDESIFLAVALFVSGAHYSHYRDCYESLRPCCCHLHVHDYDAQDH